MFGRRLFIVGGIRDCSGELVGRFHRSVGRGVIVLVALATTACGGDMTGTGGEVVMTVETPVQPPVETGEARPVAVRVQNGIAQPVAGLLVVGIPEFGAGVLLPAEQVTGSDGVARFEWKLGPTPGPQAVVFNVEGRSAAPLRHQVGATAAAVATVGVSPANLTLTVGGAPGGVSAELRDRRGAVLSGQSVTWSSSAPSVATVTGSGVVTAVGPGTAVLTAQAGSAASGTASVTVWPAVAITTGATLPTALVGQAYAQALTASGGTGSYTWRMAPGSSAPSGLSLSTTGTLSGTPTAGGTYGFTAEVMSGGASAVRTFSLVVQAPPASPSAPTVGSATSSSLTVSWGAVSGAVRYEVRWAPSATGLWTDLGTQTSPFVHTGRASGTAYWYQVAACNAAGCSGWSAAGTGSTTLLPPAPPSAPTVGSATSSSLTVSWGAVSGAVRYEVRWAPSATGVWTDLGTQTSPFVHTGRASGTAYWYQVAACNAAGCSGWSVAGMGTTSGPVPGSTVFQDRFDTPSTLIANWDQFDGTWQVESGILIGTYSIGCGAPGCPQAQLIVKPDRMPAGTRWRASVDFTYDRTDWGAGYDIRRSGASVSLFQSVAVKHQFGVDESSTTADLPVTMTSINWAHQRFPWTNLGSGRPTSLPWQPRGWNTVTLERDGATYRLYFNGQLLYTTNITDLASPRVGINVYGRSRLDNFRIETY
jgi:hypothetical protein